MLLQASVQTQMHLVCVVISKSAGLALECSGCTGLNTGPVLCFEKCADATGRAAHGICNGYLHAVCFLALIPVLFAYNRSSWIVQTVSCRAVLQQVVWISNG
jgi:hypothetical protein